MPWLLSTVLQRVFHVGANFNLNIELLKLLHLVFLGCRWLSIDDVTRIPQDKRSTASHILISEERSHMSFSPHCRKQNIVTDLSVQAN